MGCQLAPQQRWFRCRNAPGRGLGHRPSCDLLGIPNLVELWAPHSEIDRPVRCAIRCRDLLLAAV